MIKFAETKNRYYGTDRFDTRNFSSNIYNITYILGCGQESC